MTIGYELFKLVLDGEFYNKNKHRISEDLFPDELKSLVSTVIQTHSEQEHPQKYNSTEALALYSAKFPTLTNSKKRALLDLLLEVDKTEEISELVGEEILREAWKEYICRLIADESLRIAENKSNNWGRIEALVDQAKSGYIKEEQNDYIEADLDKLLDHELRNYNWSWNYPMLNDRLGGLGPGIFTIIAARPNVGKTGLWVSLTFGPGGWLDQGAKVHILCNEEPAFRTFLRGVCSKVGSSIQGIRENPDQYKEQVKALKDKVFIKDISTFTIDELESYCEGKEIDILIVDQLDKIGGTDSGNTSEALQKLYERLRLIGKKYNLAPIAITQAGAAAEGKLYFGYDKLNNSKTGKAGEADIILCIGAHPKQDDSPDDGFRVINIAKQKSPVGNSNPVPCFFNNKLSRLENERTTHTA